RFRELKVDAMFVRLRRRFFGPSGRASESMRVKPTLMVSLRRLTIGEGRVVEARGVLVVREAKAPRYCANDLARLLSLSPMQACLVHELMGGGSLDSFGVRAGIKKATQRYHLEELFSKFECRSQIEVVRRVSLLLSGLP